MPGWNFADIWEPSPTSSPTRRRRSQGDRRRVLGRVRPAGRRHRPHAARRAASQHQDKVAQYLYNCPEYLESMFGAFKAGLVPVNTNYRYVDDELRLPVGQRRRRRRRVPRHASPSASRASATGCPRCSPGCGSTTASGPCPDWAAALRGRRGGTPTERVVAPWGRGGDDLLLHLHRRHHRHAQGRDVAPGRPDAAVVVGAANPLFSGASPTTTPCATAAHRRPRRIACCRPAR